MSIWETYPAAYRQTIVQAIASATRAGECVALAGLSGSGKSNLLSFIAHRLGRDGELPGVSSPHPAWVLVDCNRLGNDGPHGLFDLVAEAVNGPTEGADGYSRAEAAVRQASRAGNGLSLLFDRFDALNLERFPAVAGRLRALRDLFKYELTYVVAARRPLETTSELAELFYSHVLWLGCLSADNAAWSAGQYALRKGMDWPQSTVERLVELSWGYPAFLRAACEAHAAGCALTHEALLNHAAVQLRLAEFWADRPGAADLAASGLNGHPLLAAQAGQLQGSNPSMAVLTAKENLLWQYFHTHPHSVCEKDDLVRAVWPEDRIFERGVRDDSLAQLVRRLREKIEPNPSAPQQICTVPGRGYRFIPSLPTDIP